jgi:hypothetical protein
MTLDVVRTAHHLKIGRAQSLWRGLRDEACGIRGEAFLVESVAAMSATDSHFDMGRACHACVKHFRRCKRKAANKTSVPL